MPDFSTPLQNMTLFISHSRVDDSLSINLREALEQQGARVWVDQANMAPGVSVQQQIESALNHSNAFIFIATNSSVISFWCGIELGIALGIKKPVFPIAHGTDYISLPPIISGLSCCTMDQISSQLVPAITQLRTDLHLIDAHALRIEIETVVSLFVSEDLRWEMSSVLMDAMSADKGFRRIGHIRIRRMPSPIRAQYLDVLDRLVSSEADHIRGEAYYCLGQIPDHSGRLRHDAEFFVRGLYDSSDKVKSCCANVMRNLVPLPDMAVNRLEQFIALGAEQMPLYSDRSGMVYWAHLSLDAHSRSLQQK